MSATVLAAAVRGALLQDNDDTVGWHPFLADLFDASDPVPSIFVALLDHKTAPVRLAKSLPWSELSSLLGNVKIGPKEGAAWMPAVIEPGPRTGARVASTTALVLDVEADTDKDKTTGIKTVIGPEPPTFESMATALKVQGWRCILHSSHSHHDPAILPSGELHHRYRIVFALIRPLTKAEIRPLGLHVASLLGVGECLDKGCLEPARLYYLPRCPSDRRGAFSHRDIPGVPLEVDALLPPVGNVPFVGESGRSPTQDADAEWRSDAGFDPAICDETKVADLRRALAFFAAASYDDWQEVGNSLKKSGDWGKDLFHEWSSKSANYSREETEQKWATAFTNPRADYRHIFKSAEKRGWKNAPIAENAVIQEWGDPEPLPRGIPPVAAFDLDLLPDALRPWIADIADRMQCPADYPAVSAVVCLASVVGRQMGIRPKRQDDWTVVPNLWGAIIGRPSLLKTPALQETMRGIDILEMDARLHYELEQANHTAALMVAEAKVKDLKTEIGKAVKAGAADLAHKLAVSASETPSEPVRRRYRTQDATVEKLGELLRDNPRGLLVYRDELVGLLKSLDQEGREGSRAFYLEAWNGTGGFTFDRIGRGTVEIEAACLSIIGGIQPGPLGDYLAGTVRGGAGDDGLLQRFQLAVWPDAPREWTNVDRWPDSDARQTARAIFERLDAVDAKALGAVTEEGIPWMRFAPDAQDAFDNWRAALEHRLRAGELHPALESHLAKYRSLAPTLALLFRLADNPHAGPVDLVSLERALKWCEYLETHARRIYHQAINVDMSSAHELARRLYSLPDPFTARDVYRNEWRLLDKQGTAAALGILEDFGHIKTDLTPATGRQTIRYRVHPSLRADALKN